MSALRRKVHARFVEAGFWAQLVLLALVDWGSVRAMSTAGVSWPVLSGLVAVNGVLLALAVVMLRWMRARDGTARG